MKTPPPHPNNAQLAIITQEAVQSNRDRRHFEHDKPMASDHSACALLEITQGTGGRLSMPCMWQTSLHEPLRFHVLRDGSLCWRLKKRKPSRWRQLLGDTISDECGKKAPSAKNGRQYRPQRSEWFRAEYTPALRVSYFLLDWNFSRGCVLVGD